MQTITTAGELRRALAEIRKPNKRVGLVPTMGYLHDGPLGLIEASRTKSDVTVLSIFVNPLNLDQTRISARIHETSNVMKGFAAMPALDCCLRPTYRRSIPLDLTPSLTQARSQNRCVELSGLDIFVESQPSSASCSTWSGPISRFSDKRTFSNARSCIALQLISILPVEIVTAPTVREPDGLAMSSRNRYLSNEERRRALAISRGLFAAEAAFHAGERACERLVAIAAQYLNQVDRVQYLDLVDADTLRSAATPLSRPAALCAAAYVGSTRLIDSVILRPETGTL